MIVSGDFKESIRSENMKNFINETWLYDVFTETNGVAIEKGKQIISMVVNA